MHRLTQTQTTFLKSYSDFAFPWAGHCSDTQLSRLFPRAFPSHCDTPISSCSEWPHAKVPSAQVKAAGKALRIPQGKGRIAQAPPSFPDAHLLQVRASRNYIMVTLVMVSSHS